MIFKKLLKYILLFIILLSIVLSCSTGKFIVQSKDNPVKTIEEKGIKLTLQFLNEETLIKRFGKDNNPFLSCTSALGLNRIMVFELTVDAFDKKSLIRLNKIELQFGRKNKKPLNRFQLDQFWKSVNKKGDIKGKDISRMSLLIKKHVIPNDIDIEKRAGYNGLLVFMSSFPDYGNARIYVPVFKEDGELINNFRYDFEF